MLRQVSHARHIELHHGSSGALAAPCFKLGSSPLLRRSAAVSPLGFSKARADRFLLTISRDSSISYPQRYRNRDAQLWSSHQHTQPCIGLLSAAGFLRKIGGGGAVPSRGMSRGMHAYWPLCECPQFSCSRTSPVALRELRTPRTHRSQLGGGGK